MVEATAVGRRQAKRERSGGAQAAVEPSPGSSASAASSPAVAPSSCAAQAFRRRRRWRQGEGGAALADGGAEPGSPLRRAGFCCFRCRRREGCLGQGRLFFFHLFVFDAFPCFVLRPQ